LCFGRPKHSIWSWTEPTRLISLPLTGGPAKLLVNEHGLYSVRCARQPANICVLGEHGLTDLVFYTLDPAKGKGRELARTPADFGLDQDDWDLSPDGSKIAISSSGESDGRIRILALSGEATAELNIKGHSGFQSMDW